MKSLNKGIQILNNLGLTTLQAKVYLSLSNNGKATIKSISKFANIDRSNVYKTINVLQQLGLVQQIIDYPNFYQAIPLQNGIKLLIGQKKQKELQIEEQIGYFLKENLLSHPVNTEENEPKFIMIPQKQAFTKLKNEVHSAQYSIEILTTPTAFPEIIEYIAKCNRLSELRVKPRVLVEKYDPEKFTPKELHGLFANLDCEIRSTLSCPLVNISIFDGKKALLVIDSASHFSVSPILSTNYLGLISLLKDYFEGKWNRAKEIKTHKLSTLQKNDCH